MDEVNLTVAQLKRLHEVGQPVVILNVNTDSGRIYYERAKYRGRSNEGKWLDRNGREPRRTDT